MENRKLEQYIVNKIKSKGRITFKEFMEDCLYHPFGYYQRKEKIIGKKGDYYTNVSVHPVFGELIAKQVLQIWEIMGMPEPFFIFEMGAEQGFLCHDFLSRARTYSKFYNSLKYLTIETGTAKKKMMSGLLQSFFCEGRWENANWDEILKGEKKFQGCFISNELIDSFPVHLITKINGSLSEIYVTHKNGQFQEIIGELSSDELADYFNNVGIILSEGQRAEVNITALRLISEVDSIIKKGFIITIDYGYPAKKLYGPKFFNGTLMGYYKHTSSIDPYINIGLQDLTSHVDFTSLINKATELGWEVTGFTTQVKFLLGLGIQEEIENVDKVFSSPVEILKNRLAMQSLLALEGGLGETFKVLILNKGLKTPELDGFKYEENACPN
ncbi:MAG: SAM-dependent methyltransferase [Thermodesulfobacteriota bacterium]|nr:SAM-dependent methyltransferase [Thermodesulfobacteriota bacterium]